jgi:hypothetical protein
MGEEPVLMFLIRVVIVAAWPLSKSVINLSYIASRGVHTRSIRRQLVSELADEG